MMRAERKLSYNVFQRINSGTMTSRQDFFPSFMQHTSASVVKQTYTTDKDPKYFFFVSLKVSSCSKFSLFSIHQQWVSICIYANELALFPSFSAFFGFWPISKVLDSFLFEHHPKLARNNASNSIDSWGRANLLPKVFHVMTYHQRWNLESQCTLDFGTCQLWT